MSAQPSCRSTSAARKQGSAWWDFPSRDSTDEHRLGRISQRRPMPPIDIEEQKLKRRIRELASRHVRWGRRLAYRSLLLDGWSVNH